MKRYHPDSIAGYFERHTVDNNRRKLKAKIGICNKITSIAAAYNAKWGSDTDLQITSNDGPQTRAAKQFIAAQMK